MTTVERYREAILRAVEMLKTVKRKDCIALASELTGIVSSGPGRRKGSSKIPDDALFSKKVSNSQLAEESEQS